MQTHKPLSPAPHRLHLGHGPDHRPGWIHVDGDPASNADIQASGEDLSMLEGGSCSVIEARQVLHRMDPERARAALREWRRLLEPGGELLLELPDLARCLQHLGRDGADPELGLEALFGYGGGANPNPARWAWSAESLARELDSAGFVEIQRTENPTATPGSASRDLDMWISAKCPAEALNPAANPSTRHVFAWPNYREPADLDHFFNVFARVLVDREDVCLQLRIDPQVDPEREAVLAALGDSHARVLGEDALLQVALFEGPLTEEDWREAGRCMDLRIQLDSEEGPRQAARQMDTPTVMDGAGLFHWLRTQPERPIQAPNENNQDAALAEPSPAPSAPDPVVPEASAGDRIAALHPWHYPLTIDDITVQPGVGSGEDSARIAYRVGCRSTLLLQEIFSRVDFRGKSLLDLGCNCGFWSSFYATAGATRVLGVDKELRHVAQAELYWGANGFLPVDAYEFMQADLSQQACWDGIRARGPVDITLCAGALHHITNHAEVLTSIAETTRECLILDTRVRSGAAGGNASTPDREQLLQTLRELHFEPEILPVGFANQVGIDGADSYTEGTRVVILARRR